MNDDILVVKQNPSRLAGPFPVLRADAVLRQPLFHPFGNGPDLPRRIRAGDHELIGETAHSADIEDGQVPRLDGRRSLGSPLCDRRRIDGTSPF
jgi:hypothetical protein